MNSQNWNAEEYNANAAFVAQLGNSVLEILAPQPEERILDLGCGDGKLTQKIQKYGCHVLGIDSSEEMINATRKLGIKTKVITNHTKVPYKHGDIKFETVFDSESDRYLLMILDYSQTVSIASLLLRPIEQLIRLLE